MCAPSSRAGQRSATIPDMASPNGRCRALSSSPPSTAATGLPPAATTATTRNCEPPASTNTDMPMVMRRRDMGRRGQRPVGSADHTDGGGQGDRVAEIAAVYRSK